MLLEDHKSFESVADLNAAIYTHLCDHWANMNDTDRKTLKILARYAVKYSGAAHLKAATLGELIGKTEKTARRVLNKLQQLGILRKIKTIRPKSKGTGANIIQIQAPDGRSIQQDVQSEGDIMSMRSDGCTQRQASAGGDSRRVQTSNYKTTKKHIKETDPNESAGLMNAIPGELYAAMRPYFNSADLYKMIGVLWHSKTCAGGSAILVEDWAKEYANAFRYAITLYKQRKISNLEGYLFRAWESVAAWIRRKTEAAKNPMFYDWLNT